MYTETWTEAVQKEVFFSPPPKDNTTSLPQHVFSTTNTDIRATIWAAWETKPGNLDEAAGERSHEYLCSHDPVFIYRLAAIHIKAKVSQADVISVVYSLEMTRNDTRSNTSHLNGLPDAHTLQAYNKT